ncbi:hypothetical protein DB30_01588 [Enhygromyxa salina]|uniref:Uncharacterized protein n=1 Tax=Enhygromyxa salina TaxID=215803 RepID=A0A0C2CRR1_9BACT|nr:hypothetical protein [Enhygromyxa salina]KIG12320.1 hypothetical protein DB30_01588 [Enhygromyxa salina]
MGLKPGVGSDLEVLNRGFLPRLGVLVLLVIAALAAAVWSGTRKHGSGEPEQRQRLLVVSAGNIDYYTLLVEGGFSIEVDGYDDWQAAARELLPESEAEGVALILALADERGFGFVVWESPGQFDFTGLELEPGIDEIEDFASRDYAVLSVGDLSFPHRLSVDTAGELPFMRVPGFGTLEALFGQPAIGAREDETRPTIEELQYEDAIERARWMYERAPSFAAAIELAGAAIDASLAQDPLAPALVQPFAAGSAVPTPDGGVLLVDHDLEVYSTDARTLGVYAGEQLRLRYLSGSALERLFETGELDPVACPSLAGGNLDMRRRPRIEAAIDGSAIAIHTRGGEAEIWWKLDQPGCEWREQAGVTSTPGAVIAPQFGVEPGTQQVQRVLMAEASANEVETSTLRVWMQPQTPTDASGESQGAPAGRIEARERDEAPASDDMAEPVQLLRMHDHLFSNLAFVDPRYLALLSRTSARDEHALHVVDIEHPGAHLRIPSLFILQERDRELYDLAVLSPAQRAADASESSSGFAHGPRFLVAIHPNAGTELIVIEVGATAWGLFVEGASVPGEAGLFTLTPDDLRVEIHDAGDDPWGFSLSPQADALAYEVVEWPLDSELALRRIGGPEQRLTNNDLPDVLPRYTADGRHLVYASMLKTSLSPDAFSVPRIMRVTPAPAAVPASAN